jgi:hypothetical protein
MRQLFALVSQCQGEALQVPRVLRTFKNLEMAQRIVTGRN